MVAQDDYRAAAGSSIVGCCNRTAKHRLCTQHAKVVAGDETGWSQDRRSIRIRVRWTHADLVRKAAIRSYSLEWTGVGLELAGKRPREHSVETKINATQNSTVIAVAEVDQLLRITDRKVLE